MTAGPTIRRLADGIVRLKPGHLICAIIAIEAVLALFFVRVPPMYAKSSYHFGFVDDYDKLGLMLSQGHGYRFMPETGPTLMREPGYPLLLAAIFSIFGYGLIAVRAVNLICAGLAAWMLAKVAARISASKLTPLVAVFLFLVHPGVFVAELRGGVETVFILLLLCFFVALYRAIDTKTLAAYFFAGLVLGVASTVRSTALLFPAFLPVFFIFGETPRPSVAAMARRLLVIAVGAGLVLSPWMIRNFMLVGSPIPTASVQGIAAHAGLYICKHLSADTEFSTLDFEAAKIRVDLARQQGYRFESDYYLYFYDPHDEVKFNGWLGAQVAGEYRRSPALFAKCATQNAFNFWFAGTTWGATILNVAVQLPYLLIAALGSIAYVRAVGGRRIAVLLLFCAYSMLVYMPIHAQARYSVPLVPFLALLAAAGFSELAFKSSPPAASAAVLR